MENVALWYIYSLLLPLLFRNVLLLGDTRWLWIWIVNQDVSKVAHQCSTSAPCHCDTVIETELGLKHVGLLVKTYQNVQGWKTEKHPKLYPHNFLVSTWLWHNGEKYKSHSVTKLSFYFWDDQFDSCWFLFFIYHKRPTMLGALKITNTRMLINYVLMVWEIYSLGRGVRGWIVRVARNNRKWVMPLLDAT